MLLLTKRFLSRARRILFLRFTLRTAFLVFTAIAISVALYRAAVHRQEIAVRAVRASGGHISYGPEYPYLADRFAFTEPPERPWHVTLLGDDFFYNVTWVSLSGNRQVDRVLESVGRLRHVTSLSLDSSEVSDAGIRHISHMPRLKVLSLRDTGVTDDAVVHLMALKHLESLDLHWTRITNKGADRLRAALPQCRISRQEPIGEVLKEPVPADFGDTPLQDVIAFLDDFCSLRIAVDPQSDVDLDDYEVTIDAGYIPLTDALTKILEPHGLTYQVDEEFDTITIVRR